MAAVNKRTHAPTPEDVYVGRPSRWGNPYTHDPQVAAKYGTAMKLVASREEAVECYRQQLWEDIKSGARSIEDLAALDGKPLVCWCAPQACHADVLTAAAAWATAQIMIAGCARQDYEAKLAESDTLAHS